MVKIVIIIGALMLAPLVCTSTDALGGVKEFKHQLDTLDKIMGTENFNCSEAFSWWDLTDKMVLSLLNDSLKGNLQDVSVLGGRTIDIEGMTIRLKDSGRITINYESVLSIPSLERADEATQSLGIGITPLTTDRTILFVGYNRIWNYSNQSKVMLAFPGTFRVLEKNRRTGRYQIRSKQEQTNFYSHVAESHEFKYVDGQPVSECLWRPNLDVSSFTQSDSSLVFQTIYVIGLQGSPMQSTMTVSWKYSNNGRLQSTEFIYSTADSLNDPNVKISQNIKEGRPVAIPEH